MSFPESIRLEVQRKAHFACCICKRVGPPEVHHILPRADGGPDLLDNAAPLCPTCHETYGANPTKRKFIRDARDHWYEICSKKHASENDRLSQLFTAIQSVDEKINQIALSQPNPTKKQPDGSDGESIGSIIRRLVDERLREDQAADISIKTTYRLFFETKGDAKSDFDKEFNEMRAKFLARFGRLVAEGLIGYTLRHEKIDWTKGVIESKMNKALNDFFIAMVFLMDHEDFEGEHALEITFTKSGDLKARISEKKKST